MKDLKRLRILDQEVTALMWRSREKVLKQIQLPFEAELKSSHKDLVTVIDRENERFLAGQLRQLDLASRIVSEEGFGDQVTDLSGHVWIVDPLDGTMNLVRQQDNFYIMVALYIDGQPTLGYIMDVMGGILFHGGRSIGVYANDCALPVPINRTLTDSLVALNARLFLSCNHNFKEIARRALGLRMYGSAGMEITYVLTGRLGAYLSYLAPWDLAAGRVLAEALRLVVRVIDGSLLNMLASNLVLIATSQAADDIFSVLS